jgi:Cation/multidrug efflux pump
MNIVKLSVIRPTVVVVFCAVLLYFGMSAYSRLPQELMPNIEIPAIVVTVEYPGAGAYEVESSVTKRLEDALSSLEGLDNIKSISMQGVSLVAVDFTEDTDIVQSVQQASQKINTIKGELPDEAREASIEGISSSDFPILNIAVSSALSDAQTYDLVKNEIKPLLDSTAGVASASISGGREREIQVNLDVARLHSYQLSITDVTEAIAGSNLDFPAGSVKSDNRRASIRLSGQFKSLDEIAATIVRADAGGYVRVRDVGQVLDTLKDQESIIRVNGENAIGLSVIKRIDANAVSIAHSVQKLGAQLEKKHADKQLRFNIVHDTSVFTEAATEAVVEDLLLAVVLVALVMLLFLGSIQNMFIVIVSIPVSLISTLAVMHVLGFSLNLLSLVGLSLVVGVLVDDAIVVLENIHRHLEMKKPLLEAVYDGLSDIMGTVVSITAVIVVVLLPLAFVGGMIAPMFRQFSVVVAVATVFSFLASFTVVPALAARMGGLKEQDGKNLRGRLLLAFEKIVTGLAGIMSALLRKALAHKLLTGLLTMVLFVGSISLITFGLIGSEFAQTGDQGSFYIRLELPKSATIEQTDALTRQAEELIRQKPWVTALFSTSGSEENQQPQTNKAELLVKTVPRKERDVADQELARRTKLELQEHIAGAKIESFASSLMGGADDEPILFHIIGNSAEDILPVADAVIATMYTVPGVISPRKSIESGNPEVQIIPDKDKMAAIGVSFPELGQAVSNAYNGDTGAKYRAGKYEYDINIRLDSVDRRRADDIANFPVKSLHGEQILLRHFAEIIETEGPTQLERRNRQSSIAVSSQALGRASGDIGADIKAFIREMTLPDGVYVEFEGDTELQDDGFGAIGSALLTSIVLAYLIMVLLYNSYIYPLVIILSVPLALIGALLALALSLNTLNVFSMMGMVMLVGLVMKNAIIVVDFTNKRKAEGLPTRDALLESVHTRFRPVLMTTIAMVAGMLPIALASGPGAEWKNGIGWVLIGGLASSMFLTMIVVPLLYELFDKFAGTLSGLRNSLIRRQFPAP